MGSWVLPQETQMARDHLLTASRSSGPPLQSPGVEPGPGWWQRN